MYFNKFGNMEKKLEEYNYKELINLNSHIYVLPSFIIDDKTKKYWQDEIKKNIDIILDQLEKENGGNRKDKVERYIDIECRDSYRIENGKVYENYADRFIWTPTIDEFYMRYRYNIEILYQKIKRVAPLTKEELENMVAKDLIEKNLI